MVANKTSRFPLELFEVSDVVLKKEKTVDDGWFEGEGQTFTVNRRRFSALISSQESSSLEVA
jgi:hypothetical protein